MMRVSIKATNVWMLPLVRKKLILMNELWFRTYVTNVLQSVNECCVVKVLDDGRIDFRGVVTEKNNVCVEVKYGRVVESSSELKGCTEDYCNVYCNQILV